MSRVGRNVEPSSTSSEPQPCFLGIQVQLSNKYYINSEVAEYSAGWTERSLSVVYPISHSGQLDLKSSLHS